MIKPILESQRLEIIARQGDERLRDEIADVQGQIPEVPPPPSNASISNLIDDSDYSYSDAAFTTAGITPATATDANNRAYNWYRIERATALLVADDAHSLKGPLHSLYAGETADTPVWDKIDGWGRMGETGATPWDIVCPLPNNFVTPGLRLYIQMLVRLGTATALPGEVNFFWEFFDNTNLAPLPDIIKGGTFTVTLATFGTPGGTTRTYKLIVDTDAGDQVQTAATAIVTANAAMSPTDGVRISWPAYPGFTNVSIYVTVGGASFLVGIVGDGASSFLDTGQTLRPVGSVPSATGTVPRAYAQTRSGQFVPTLDWVLYEFTIGIPSTYDFSKTTGKQWLRGGVIGLMGDPRQLQIDRIGVSTGTGKWSISEGDRKALSLPSTTQTGSTQGAPSGTTGGSDGSGGPACSTLETPVQVCDKDGRGVRSIRLEHVHRGDHVRSRLRPNRVIDLRIGWSDSIITIATENGARRRCSPSDLWIVRDGPPTGTCARRLCEGMEVETRRNGSIQYSPIVLHSTSIKGEEIRILSLEGDNGGEDDHIYYAGDAAVHNVKPNQE